MSKLVSKIVVLILGALVLIGCQKQGEDAAWERPRMAGETMDSVKTASGKLLAIKCVKDMIAADSEVTADALDKECGNTKTKAVSDESAATVGRNRLFYGNVDLRGYYYIPYYINYSYTTDYVNPTYGSNTSSSSSSDICKLILGVSCKKASKWWNNYFGYDYTTNNNQYNQYNQSYNQGCYSWLNYNYNYSYNLYGNNNTGGGGYSYLWTSPVYDGNTSSSWNNNWYGCYNVYY